ncbi:beta-mannosidase [Phthorimaea operculella]|nr:beta-mannosidase [Phthorimaea operculella]
MNMLRVWGGGVYESDLFYDQCDELGILIWQDFMFACSMYPVDKEFMDSVRTEVEQNVKRLQHHASIAIWAGNNENEAALRGNWYHTAAKFDEYKHNYIKLYVDTIKPIVEHLDPDRRYLVSSPSNGKKSEQDGYISMNPYDSHYGDTHYYNYIADVWDMNIYPLTRFASEYGFQSYPTLLTYETATNVSEDYRMDSEFNQHRQHSPAGYQTVLNQITKHLKFGKCEYCLQPVAEEDDYMMFKKFVLYSQIVQAMAIKAETEFYRQSQETWYTMGALYWQLNDVWQAPSWSSIDYQRRWKMLQYFAVRFFAPVLVSPRLQSSGHLDIYLLNDRFVPIVDAQIKVDLYSWSSLVPLNSTTFVAQAEPLSAKKQDVYMDFWQGHNKDEVFLMFWMTADGVSWTPHNYVFPKPLKSIKGLKKPNITLTVSRIPSEPNLYKYQIDIKVDTIVLFLWLETPPILHSYFEDNGLVITTPDFRTNYVSTIEVTEQELKDMITIQYYYEE